MALLGMTWGLADVLLSAVSSTVLFYVGFEVFFLARRACNCPLSSAGQSHQSSRWRLNVLAACSKYPLFDPAVRTSLR